MKQKFSLGGCFAKIKRTETQIYDLGIAIDQFFFKKPYEIISQVDADRTQEVWSFRLAKDIPYDIQIRTGEILHNIRSSFDQMMVTLALKVGGREWKTNGIYFPFGRCEDHFKGQLKEKTENLPPACREAAQNLIWTAKPYKGADDLLFALHDLNRRDKHIELAPVRGIPGLTMSHIGLKSGKLLVLGNRYGQHMTINGAPLPPDPGIIRQDGDLEFLTTTPGSKFETDLQPARGITFQNVPGWEGQPITAVLSQMGEAANRILLTFEKRFFP